MITIINNKLLYQNCKCPCRKPLLSLAYGLLFSDQNRKQNLKLANIRLLIIITNHSHLE